VDKEGSKETLIARVGYRSPYDGTQRSRYSTWVLLGMGFKRDGQQKSAMGTRSDCSAAEYS
jgi:hypothetical protein